MHKRDILIVIIASLLLFNLAFSVGIGSGTSSKTTGTTESGAKQGTDNVSGTSNISNVSNVSKAKCDLPTMKERLRCFINLPDEDIRNINYIPEDCRVKMLNERNDCIEKYRLFQTCRYEKTDEERDKCIIPKLNISNTVREEVEKCKQLIPQQRNICMTKIKEKVLLLVKFRIYNLVYKAQKFRDLGVPEENVVEILEKIANAKINIERGNKEDKIRTLENLKNEWANFVNASKSYIKEGRK
jgi:hypothetical protein